MEAKEETPSFGYAKLEEETRRRPPSSWTFQRLMVVACVALVTFTLCGLLGGVIALRVHLQLTSGKMMKDEGQLVAYETIIGNLTDVIQNDKVGNFV